MNLHCLMPGVTLLLLLASTALAAPRELTVFSDGVLVELETTTSRGVAELPLPGQIRAQTLRVKPLDNGTITSVELLSAKVPDKLQRELDTLNEQKNRLQDRLKALDTREEIFAAAAKSQSSKAPRKTKTNPDPLTAVRQGTSFAIAQLEAVFTARRHTEQELKRIESRLTQLQQQAVGLPTVRIATSPASVRLRVAAVLTARGWTPHYTLHLQGNGSARLTMQAIVPALPGGFHANVSPTAMSAAPQLQQTPPLLQPSGNTVTIEEWQLPLEKEQVVSGPLPSFALLLKNSTNRPLAAGMAAVYNHGEYIGLSAVPATPVGGTITLATPNN